MESLSQGWQRSEEKGTDLSGIIDSPGLGVQLKNWGSDLALAAAWIDDGVGHWDEECQGRSRSVGTDQFIKHQLTRHECHPGPSMQLRLYFLPTVHSLPVTSLSSLLSMFFTLHLMLWGSSLNFFPLEACLPDEPLSFSFGHFLLSFSVLEGFFTLPH